MGCCAGGCAYRYDEGAGGSIVVAVDVDVVAGAIII
jgi:hypothetical protein